jgi:hypothetical protein
MRRGVLSYCKVRAMTRIATPENEAYLVHGNARAEARRFDRRLRGVFAGFWRGVGVVA